MVVIPRSPTAPRPGAEQHRCDVGDDLVDQPGLEERGGQGRSALEEDVLAVAGEQVGQRLVRVAGAEVDGLGPVVEDPPAGVDVAQPHHGTQRLARQRLVDLVADGQFGVVDGDRAGADQHRVAQRPEPVRVEPGGPAGHPAAGPVGGGTAAVEGGGELPGDERPAVLDGERPGPVQPAGAVGQQSALDLDPGVAQRLRSPGSHRVGVRLREHHAAYSCRDQGARAGAGAAVVVAGLEGDDGGGPTRGVPGLEQGRGLGVRVAGPAVEPLGDLAPRVVEDHAADPRVGSERYAGARGEGQRALHRATLDGVPPGGRGGHLPLSSSSGPRTSEGAGRRCGRWLTDASMGDRAASPACASHPDFDRRSRSSTWSTGHWL